MASSPAQLLSQDLLLLPGQALLQEWGGMLPTTEGYSSCSPTPSTDSCGLSPLHPLCPAPPEPCSSCSAAPGPGLAPRRRAGLGPAHGSRKGSRGRAGGGQRQSASEREKLRMRNLSKALHTLRRYLPPSVAPAGQSLTKIETLRLASRYISHLAELLGLSEETLAQRREGPRRRCHLCPEGLGCCQARTPVLRAASPAQREGSPAGTESWVSPTYCPAAATPPELHGALSTDPAPWLSPPYCPAAAPPAEPHGAWSPDAGPTLLPAEFADMGLSSQDLSGELFSLLEALLPHD
ncbi:mesoderm posterior protein 1-like [Emydura macquarii macquarii]|uniref:mesoderm posterior protein 1-like n=1 Tax=Emydura macquarii macquarii TaxID=1129001 RepID=UPI00352B4782